MTLLVALLALVPQDAAYSDAEIRRLVDQLGGEYEEDRAAARAKLEKAGPAAEAHLVDGIQKEDHRIRKGCLELLQILKSDKAVAPAARIFQTTHEEATVRQAAFAYLCAAGRAAEDALIEALASPELAWRKAALEALDAFDSEKCVEAVAALYDAETDGELKGAAFVYLQEIGRPALPFLLKLLGSRDPEVRKGAIDGLRTIGASSDEIFEPLSAAFLQESAPETLAAAFDTLKQAGAKAESTFLKGLTSAHEPVRLYALRGLADIKSAAIDPVAAVFENDASEHVRARAGDYLANFGTKVEDAFIRALASPTPKIRLKALQLLAGIRSAKPYEQVAQIFRNDRNAEVHRAAFDYLKTCERRAEREFLLALKKEEDVQIRREAIAMLADVRSEAAIAPLLELCADLDGTMRDLALDALVRIGPNAMAAVDAAVAAGTLPKKIAEQAHARHLQEEIERHLDRYITPEGETGAFQGQFAELAKLGADRVVPVLARIIADDKYRVRVPRNKGGEDHYRFVMRLLAIQALGELGDKGVAAAALRAAIAKRPFSVEDAEHEHLLVALHRLGDRSHYAAFAQTLSKEIDRDVKADDKLDGYTKLFRLAMVQNRVGEREAAAASYRRLLALLESANKDEAPILLADTLYNLACLSALQGEKARAIDYLTRAVDAGYREREWILVDRDLDALRNEEAFRKLLADAKRFEKARATDDD